MSSVTNIDSNNINNNKESENEENSLMKKKNKMDSNNIFLNLFRILIPTLILLIVTISYMIIDSILIAKFTTEGYYSFIQVKDFSVGNALVAYAAPFISLFGSVLFITVIGTSITYNNYLGNKKNKREMNDLMSNSFTTTVLLSISLMIILNIAALFYSNFIISSSEFPIEYHSFLIRDMRTYIFVTSLTFFSGGIIQTFLRLLRSENKAFQSSAIAVLPVIINPIFDWIFMGVIGIGIVGSALATAISSYSVLFIFLIYNKILKNKNETNIVFKFIPKKLDKNLVKFILILGTASIIRRISGFYNQFLFVTTITNLPPLFSYSQELWATFVNSMFRINSIFIIVGLATGQSAGQLIGYYFGKEEKHKIKQTIWYSLGFILFFESIFFIVLNNYVSDLLYLFGINSIKDDILLNDALSHIMTIVMAGALINAFTIIPNMYFASTKQIKKSYTVVISTQIILFTVLILSFFLLNKSFGNEQSTFFFYFYLLYGIMAFLMVVPYTLFNVSKLK